MRVVVVSGQRGVADVRAWKSCRYYVERGHEVTFVAGLDSKLDPAQPMHLQRPTWCGPGKASVATFTIASGARRSLVGPAITGAFKPELIHVHGLDVLDLLCWHVSDRGEALLDGGVAMDDVFTAGAATTWKPGVPLIYDAHEYEADRPLQWASPRTYADRGWREHVLIADVASSAVSVSQAMCEQLEHDQRSQAGLNLTVAYVPNSPFAPKRIHFPGRRAEIREAMADAGHWPDTSVPVALHIGYAFATRRLDALSRAVRQADGRLRMVQLGEVGFDRDVEHALVQCRATVLKPVPYPLPEVEPKHSTILDVAAAADVSFVGADLQWASWRMQCPNKWWESTFAGVRVVASRAVDLERELLSSPNMGVVWDGAGASLGPLLEAQAALGPVPEPTRRAWAERWCYSKAGYAGMDAAVEVALGVGARP